MGKAIVNPSLAGRLVEARAVLEALQAELYVAAREERERVAAAAIDEAEYGPAWRMLENAGDSVSAALKSALDAASYTTAARIRGWQG